MSNQPRATRQPPTERTARRPVRSFVRRGGRLTDGQKRALAELWPRFGVAGRERPLDLGVLFGNDRPVILEIGFGDGAATWRMARAFPGQNFLGIEVHPPGIGRLLLALEREGVGNVRVVSGDAVEWLSDGIAPAALDGVRIFFPDPWPKKRHSKRRLIQPEFVALLASRMKPGAVLHIATDWAPYAEHIREVIGASSEFVNRSPTGGCSERPAWRPETKYEQRGERLGHAVSDLVYVRASASAKD